MAFDCIIVNYRSYERLRECLESILKIEGAMVTGIIVVDNDSDPVKLHDFKRLYPKVKFLCSKKNLGFAQGVNLALKEVASDYVMLINPDAKIRVPFLKDALAFFQQQPKVAVLGPRIVDENGGLQGSARWDPGLLTAFFGRSSWLTRRFPANTGTKRNVVFPAARTGPMEVHWVSGACMLARMEAVEDVGPLDPRFFVYWEDCDWCRRFREHSWKVVYHPGLGEVEHSVGASSNQRSLFSTYHFHRSAFLVYAKYDTTPLHFGSVVAFLGACARFGVLSLISLKKVLSLKY